MATPRLLFPFAPERLVLPNGLRVVAVSLPHLHSTVISAHLNVGSRFENQRNNGLSHFLEHMLYRGTQTLPSAHRLSLAFEALGGTLMASTSVDTGSMMVRVPRDNFEPVLELFSEVYAAPKFDALEVERGIVREEILEGLDDSGNSVDADNLIRALVFDGHPLGMPITGTIEHVQRFDRRQLRAHHKRYYCASNTVVAIAGNIETNRVLDHVRQTFSQLPAGKAPVAKAPARANAPRFLHARQASSQTELRVGFQAPAWLSEDEAKMEVLMRVLDDGMSTRLYHEICDKHGLCYDVSGAYETYADSGLVEISAESAHDRAGRVLAEILRIVTELRESGPSSDELLAVKRRHRWQMEQMADEPHTVAEYFGLETLTDCQRSPDERQQQIDAIGVSEVREVARRWLTRENLSVVAVGSLSSAQVKGLRSQVEGF